MRTSVPSARASNVHSTSIPLVIPPTCRKRIVGRSGSTAICERGWSERAGAYTQAFGADDLDASNLMLAITGFLPGDDPRMKATIDATAERLGDERGLVYRYRTDEGVDGLTGGEGTFLLCTFWLAQAQALAGEVTAARATFERAAAYANDVGLLAEEVDVGGAEMIGNYPQAFSDIGLVNAAWAITQAEQHRQNRVDQAREERREDRAGAL